MTASLGPAQARRIALAAQGIGRRPAGSPTMRQVQQEVNRLGQFQIDSVNVCLRAQYLPLFSRLGEYDRSLLDRARDGAPRRVYEFWGHAACLIDVELEPALRWRAEAHRQQPWSAMRQLLAEQPQLIDKVRAQIADRGPLTARQIEHAEERTPGSWWNWSAAKTALEWLFYVGEITSAGRNTQFERRYDLRERVLPPQILAQPTPDEATARVILARRAAAALGIFTAAWLAEYFYTDRAGTDHAIQSLLATGEIEPVEVRGWAAPAYLWSGAKRPRCIQADALISPFDSLMFDRDRLEATFGTRYRLELYTPKSKRVHGYYVYLFLMDERFAARVDLKSDRKADALLVQAAWLEDGAAEAKTAQRLAAELQRLASWLGLGAVVVQPIGTLAAALTRALS